METALRVADGFLLVGAARLRRREEMSVHVRSGSLRLHRRFTGDDIVDTDLSRDIARLRRQHRELGDLQLATCRFCDAKCALVPVTTVKGSAVLLSWVCRACGCDRPRERRDQQSERRSGLTDRRRTTRKDRRRSR